MKKRVLSVLFCVTLFVSILPQIANTTSMAAKYEDNVIWLYNGEGTLAISGTGKMSDFEEGTAPWYPRFHKVITEGVVKSGVISIGNYAFYGCEYMSSVDIAGSVTSIGKSAFRGCSRLTSVRIPVGVKIIESYTFCNCKNLKTIVIPDDVTEIQEYAFNNCERLTSVIVPYGVSVIGLAAFSGCSSMTTVTIPNSVTTIGSLAFEYCNKLKSITIPNSVTTIGKDAFKHCSNIVIECDENSAAHKYAVDNNIEFKLISTSGNASQGNSVMYFSDVPTNAWYYSDLKAAFNAGLINGKTFMEFKPNDNMTYAEAIKLAACLHQLNKEGWITLKNGNPWYLPYVEYCRTNGIIDCDYVYSALATRAGYMNIFARALPTQKLYAINRVDDDAIPDVKMTESYAPGIYKLYRAGVVGGSDTMHNCNPNGNIKRAEVATILARMMFPDKRIKFNLEKKMEIEPTGLRLDYNKTMLVVGETDYWTAAVYPSSAIAKLTWGSSNPAVASVDQNGKITAISPGEARIMVMTTNGLMEAATVTVLAQ